MEKSSELQKMYDDYAKMEDALKRIVNMCDGQEQLEPHKEAYVIGTCKIIAQDCVKQIS